MNGIITVNKEKGFTSHDVVAKLRGMLHIKRIGHTGTLDPMAEGVLVVCIGESTKLCELLESDSKEYEAGLLLGKATDTEDISGRVINEVSKDVVLSLDEEKIRDSILSFKGSYEQIPPMYSAIKVEGKRLYELAREGKEIERKKRSVFIEEIEINSYDLPEIFFRVSCSKGTYIRSLCRDIGEKLSVFGTMSSLVRTRAGRFHLKDAKKLSEIDTYIKDNRFFELLIPPDKLFEDAPAVMGKNIEPSEREHFDRLIHNGNALRGDILDQEKEDSILVRIYDSSDRFTGLYRYEKNRDRLNAFKVFSTDS